MKYFRPASLEEACRILAEPGAQGLAGGTDLMVGLGRSFPWPETIVDLKTLPDLYGIERRGGVLRIGACATLAQMAAHAEIAKLPSIGEACRSFAARQIRNRATLGGNLVNASPAADLVPPLMTLEAVCVTDRRRIPLESFSTGPGSTILEPGEILLAVELPIPPEGSHAFFVKLAPRDLMAIAIVNLAGLLVLRDGKVALARIALGSVAPTVIRAKRSEAVLENHPLDERRIAEIALMAAEEAMPIDDIRASAKYRRLMVERILAWELSKLEKALA